MPRKPSHFNRVQTAKDREAYERMVRPGEVVTGRAVGGPRNGVKLTAKANWVGTLEKYSDYHYVWHYQDRCWHWTSLPGINRIYTRIQNRHDGKGMGR